MQDQDQDQDQVRSTRGSRITVYRTRGCAFCRMAEELLQKHGMAVEEIFLDDHPDPRSFVAEILPGHHTVPLVVVDGKPIGGYEELCQLEASRGLERLRADSL